MCHGYKLVSTPLKKVTFWMILTSNVSSIIYFLKDHLILELLGSLFFLSLSSESLKMRFLFFGLLPRFLLLGTYKYRNTVLTPNSLDNKGSCWISKDFLLFSNNA